MEEGEKLGGIIDAKPSAINTLHTVYGTSGLLQTKHGSLSR